MGQAAAILDAMAKRSDKAAPKQSAEARAVVVAVGAVFRAGKILLIRRNFEPFIGCWGMPGGKIRFGEHIEDAVEREVWEESGVRARFRRFCGVLSERVRLKAGPKILRAKRPCERSNSASVAGSPPDMHYLVLVSELRVKGDGSRRKKRGQSPQGLGQSPFSVGVTSSREGEVRWFPVKDLTGLRKAMIPSDYLLLRRSVLRKTGTRYFRCEIAKRGGKYRVERFG